MTGLVLDGVGLRIGRARLLEDLSLELRPGRVLAMVGPNGAGKSSCLAVASGSTRPSEGTVRLDGRPLSAWSRVELAQRRAVVTQRTELAFAFTALEVVLLGRHPYCGGVPTRRDMALAEAAMQRLGVLHLASRDSSTLSGGERQRVQLARSLAQLAGFDAEENHSSRYWLLDEPTSALDLKHQREVLRLCREEAERGHAVLVVLHDLDLALGYADEVAVLDQGRCRQLGPPLEVLTPELMQSVYDVRAAVRPGAGDTPPHLVVLG
jgi:iron complex transport system ATP-binding protein